MQVKPVRMRPLFWPCVACLWLASPPSFAEEAKQKAKIPDIQGTWNLVSWERDGKAEKPQSLRVFITEPWIYSEGVSLPDDKGGETWRYELAPGDKPNAASMNLVGSQGRDLVPAIC